MITVVGMGRKRGDLTLDGAEAIKKSEIVVIKSHFTHIADVVEELSKGEAVFCDDLIEQANDFDELNNLIFNRLQSLADREIAFCVVGDGSDDSVAQMLGNVRVIAGVGLQASVVQEDMRAQTVIYTAFDFIAAEHITAQPTVVKGIGDEFIASDVLLKLQQAFDYDNELLISCGDTVKHIRLNELLKQKFDYKTSLYIVPKRLQDRNVFGYYDAFDVLMFLRGENGCPWDREQTHKSIVKNVIEEAYELANALENDDVPNIVEELGDLLMQILFHLEIGVDNGEFEESAVYSALCRKLIDRHPHVFCGVKAENSDQSLDIWNAQKMKEHKIKNTAQNLSDVPRNMSALMRSQKIQSRASKGGYEFENIEQAAVKVSEELDEFLSASKEDKPMEGGDLLFAAVNLLRLCSVDSETALLLSTEKFTRRVAECERILANRGQRLKDLSMPQFDEIWAEAKKNVG